MNENCSACSSEKIRYVPLAVATLFAIAFLIGIPVHLWLTEPAEHWTQGGLFQGTSLVAAILLFISSVLTTYLGWRTPPAATEHKS